MNKFWFGRLSGSNAIIATAMLAIGIYFIIIGSNKFLTVFAYIAISFLVTFSIYYKSDVKNYISLKIIFTFFVLVIIFPFIAWAARQVVG